MRNEGKEETNQRIEPARVIYPGRLVPSDSACVVRAPGADAPVQHSSTLL